MENEKIVFTTDDGEEILVYVTGGASVCVYPAKARKNPCEVGNI